MLPCMYVDSSVKQRSADRQQTSSSRSRCVTARDAAALRYSERIGINERVRPQRADHKSATALNSPTIRARGSATK